MYLIIYSASGYFKEKYSEKYLILDSVEKYEEVSSGIKKKLKQLMVEKSYDDAVPLNKPLKFSTLTIIIRCVFQNGNKLQLQVYLDECLYEL